jgi:hypothetical protein
MHENMEQKLKDGMSKETDEDLRYMMSKVNDNLTTYHPGNLILTDDKAPVELLGMKIIDSLIAEEVSFYKEIYKKEGLKGLLNEF